MAHPVVTKNYSLFTPAIDELVDTCGQWIDSRFKGGTIFGPSQFGKSNGVHHWLGRLLEERLKGRVALSIWTHQDHGSSASPAGFHSKLLKAANEGYPIRANAQKTMQMLLEKLIQLAFRNESGFVVLVIDEAQGLSQREWLWLVQLHATLEPEGVQLCVISIASLQYNEKPREMALTGSAHAAARFMLHDREFRGLKSCDEIEYAFAGYDEDSEWPAGSGLSYSAGLAPRAFEEGFRISNYSARLWDMLHECLPMGYGGAKEFPMQSITLAARQVLLRVAGASSNWEEAVDLGAWRDAVLNSGHKRLMSLVSMYAGKSTGKK
jgi:hypothetical protein